MLYADIDLMAVIGVASAAAGSLLTILLTKGTEALLKFRQDRRIDVIREGEDLEDTYRFIIKRQDDRITHLEAEMQALRGDYNAELLSLQKDHAECEKRHAVLETKVQQLERDLAAHTLKP